MEKIPIFLAMRPAGITWMPEAVAVFFVAFVLGAALFQGFRRGWPKSPEKQRLTLLWAGGLTTVALLTAFRIVWATAAHPGADLDQFHFVAREFVPGLVLFGMAGLLLARVKAAYEKK